MNSRVPDICRKKETTMKTSRPTVATGDTDDMSTAETVEAHGERRRDPQRSGRDRRQQALGPPGGPGHERRTGIGRRQRDRRVA